MQPHSLTRSVKSDAGRSTTSPWERMRTPNLKRFRSSGVFFAVARVKGKLLRKSLKTKVRSVAELKLSDFLQKERAAAAGGRPEPKKGGCTFGDLLPVYRQELADEVNNKESSRHYREQTINALLRSWTKLAATDIKKITPEDCGRWAANFSKKYSATRYNNTLGTLRAVMDIAVRQGYRLDNPARADRLKRRRVVKRPVDLPDSESFAAFLDEIRNGHGRYSDACADLAALLAFSGCRIGESRRLTWADVDFTRNTLRIAGDPVTGTKNWQYRTIPMTPELGQLLKRMRAERQDEQRTASVCQVGECQHSMDRAARVVGTTHGGFLRLTHHKLRDYFATACLEQGVDVPTIALWLGHKDGGVLVLRTYVHPRQGHGREAAEKVRFTPKSLKPA